MKSLLLLALLTLTSCMDQAAFPTQTKVKVVEILSMQYRTTIFLGDDGKSWKVTQETYQKGSTMNCFTYARDPKMNYCVSHKTDEQD